MYALCVRDKGVPTDWTKAASRQLEELRPSLASWLPALQTATPISQLTPETSFPCCWSWQRPLSAPPTRPLSWSSYPATTIASACKTSWRRLYHLGRAGKEAQVKEADYSAGALQLQQQSDASPLLAGHPWGEGFGHLEAARQERPTWVPSSE